MKTKDLKFNILDFHIEINNVEWTEMSILRSVKETIIPPPSVLVCYKKHTSTNFFFFQNKKPNSDFLSGFIFF